MNWAPSSTTVSSTPHFVTCSTPPIFHPIPAFYNLKHLISAFSITSALLPRSARGFALFTSQEFSSTPLQSILSALFSKNTGGGYTPSIRLLFSRTYALLKIGLASVRGACLDRRPRPLTRNLFPPSLFLSRHSFTPRGVEGPLPPLSPRWRPR